MLAFPFRMVEVLILSEEKKKIIAQSICILNRVCACLIVFKSVWIFFPSIEETHSIHIVYISLF